MNSDNIEFREYVELKNNGVNIHSSMIKYIKDPYALKIYLHLCSKNDGLYANCSINEIGDATDISVKKVKDCIKWLNENNCIKTCKYESGGIVRNRYRIYFIDNLNLERKLYYVYIHKEKTTGEVLYVGKGTGDRAYNLRNRNKKYLEHIRQVGKDNIEIEILKRFDNNIDAYKYEEDMTDHYKNKGQAKYSIIIGNPSL